MGLKKGLSETPQEEQRKQKWTNVHKIEQLIVSYIVNENMSYYYFIYYTLDLKFHPNLAPFYLAIFSVENNNHFMNTSTYIGIMLGSP